MDRLPRLFSKVSVRSLRCPSVPPQSQKTALREGPGLAGRESDFDFGHHVSLTKSKQFKIKVQNV